MPFAGGEPSKVYGTMPGAPVSRQIDVVLEDSIEVNGTKITFSAALAVLAAFFEKWRIEDQAKPPPPLPQAAELTPMPEQPESVEQPKPGDD
jgi:hypothetical protein